MHSEAITALEKELEGLRSKPSDSDVVSVLNKLAHFYIHSDPRKAETCVLEARDIAEKLGLLTEQAKSYRILGIINREVGKFAEAMSYCRKSMEIYEKLGDKNGMAIGHSTIASIYRAQGMIDKALEHYHMALEKKQESDNSREGLASFYFNIGACYATLDRLELSISFYEHAESVWKKAGARSHLASLYNNIGMVFGKKKELDNALEYFQKALDISDDLGDKKRSANTLGNLGNLKVDLNDNESALSLYTKSLELYEEIGNKRGVAFTCGCIGGVYTNLEHLDEAEELISRGLKITRKLKIKDWEILCLEKITDLYEAKGDLQKALKYSRELKTCLEEHLNEKSMEKIAGLQVQFETEKKEKEAEIYRLKNVELSRMNDQLRDALAHVKKLQGMLPICANCKKVRDDDGYWQQIESYISDHSDAKVTHGICPECMIKLYGKDYTQEQE